MKKDLMFSEVSSAYAANFKNLNEARQIFENECKIINNRLFNLVEEKCRNLNAAASAHLRRKFSWDKTMDESSQRSSDWATFSQETIAPINLRIPGKKNFDKKVAKLSFEISFDNEHNRFMFKIYFLNAYIKMENLDESLADLALLQPDTFKNAKRLLKSTAILGVWDINAELLDTLEIIINKSLDLVQAMVDRELPDSNYELQADEAPAFDPPESNVVDLYMQQKLFR